MQTVSKSEQNLFGRGAVNAPNMPLPRPMGPTHKKKTTYVVQIKNTMCDLRMFRLCKYTQLAVVIKNGELIQDASGWLKTQAFPTAHAMAMVEEFDSIHPAMGKLASTIVEYYDKSTGKPVLQLYPTHMYIFDGYDAKNYMEHLNHATRRDLEYQINLRDQLVGRVLAAGKQA